MRETSLRVLQAYLGLVCAFHVAIGVGVNCSRSLIETVAQLYGARVDFTPEFLAILHPLGAFMFILGVLAAVAALQPIRYRAVGYGFAALFIIRALQRIVFRQDMEEVFHIDPARNLFNMGFFLVLGVSLAALQWYAERHHGPEKAR